MTKVLVWAKSACSVGYSGKCVDVGGSSMLKSTHLVCCLIWLVASASAQLQTRAPSTRRWSMIVERPLTLLSRRLRMP